MGRFFQALTFSHDRRGMGNQNRGLIIDVPGKGGTGRHGLLVGTAETRQSIRSGDADLLTSGLVTSFCTNHGGEQEDTC